MFYQLFHTVILPDWTLKNGVSLILPSNIQNDFLKSCEGFLRYSNLSSQISTWMELDGARHIFWINSNNGTFIALQMKSFGSKKNSNYMQGLKSAILAIFHTGLVWPCPDSTALKNPLLVFKNYFCFGFLWIPSSAQRFQFHMLGVG